MLFRSSDCGHQLPFWPRDLREDREDDEGGRGEGWAKGSLHVPATGFPHSWLQLPGLHWPPWIPLWYAGSQKPDFRCIEYNSSPMFLLTGLEPRILTRWDMQKYAREAYNAGIRYIGGCCGFEAYHIRALSEELQAERGFLPAGSEKHGNWGSNLEMHTKPWVRARYRPPFIMYLVWGNA